MGTWQAPQVTSDMSVEDLRNLVAVLIKDMDYLLNGYLDSKNLKVNGIETKNLKAGSVIAEKIDVTELSAISADLGTITAGLLNAVTIIGSLIQTSVSSYPRAEMSSTDTLFKAATDAQNDIRIIASFIGYPSLVMGDSVGAGVIQYGPDLATGTNKTTIQSDNGVLIQANSGNVDLYTNSGNTKVNSWTKFVNRATGNSLQTDLNAKANAFSGFTGSFSTGTQTVNVVNGIITSVV